MLSLSIILSSCASIKKERLALTGFTGYTAEHLKSKRSYERRWAIIQWKNGQRVDCRFITDHSFKNIDDWLHKDGKNIFGNGWSKIQPEKRRR